MTMKKCILFLGLVLLIIFTGCGNPGANTPISTGTTRVTDPTLTPGATEVSAGKHTLTVYAAASLTGALQEIGKNFEAANQGLNVIFSFAGSQILRTQLEQGAKADIFASADHKNIDILVTDNLIVPNSYQDFATNKLIVILPAANPGDVHSLGDLAKPNLKLILADSSVPAGNYARQILTKMSSDSVYGSDFSAKVLANVISNETDVKQVETKVELGEADAGIVYVSDAVASPDLMTIPIPDIYNVIAKYPIAILADASDPKLAEAFISYILSPAGQAVLSKWGFKGVTQ
jgi:molybdate transport system substrate-binding protein